MTKETQRRVANSWSARQAAERCDLSEGMIGYLARKGIVSPSLSKNKGQGHRRLYAYEDLVILRAVARLLERGVEVSRLQRDLSSLQKRYRFQARHQPDLKYLVTNGSAVFLLGRDGLLEQIGTGQGAFNFVLDIDALKQDVGPDSKALGAKSLQTPADQKLNRKKGLPRGKLSFMRQA